MRRKIEVSAKKVEDAIKDGLQTLRTTMDKVDIKIISQGGFLKKAKIEIYYGEQLPDQPQAEAQEKVDTKAEKAAIKEQAKAQKIAAKQQAKPEVKSEPKQQAKSADNTKAATANAPTAAPKVATANAPTAAPKAATANAPTAAPKAATANAPTAASKFENKPRENNAPRNENRDNERRDRNRNKERDSVAPTSEQANRAVDFLTELVSKMKIVGNIEATVDDGLRLNIATDDSRIIGYHGEVLDALQYLVSLQVNTESNKFVHVSVDGLNYRAKRKDILEGMANRMAEKALRTGKKISLEPMNSADRRVIHAALGENDQIITRSEGYEPSRRIVILPKNK